MADEQSGFAQAQPTLAAFVSNPGLPDAIEALQREGAVGEGTSGDLKPFFNARGFALGDNVTAKRTATHGDDTLLGICVKIGQKLHCLELTIPTAE